MRDTAFYDILDNNLTKIISSNVDNPEFKKRKDHNQKRSFAFLIWFLQEYCDATNYSEHITDGDGDKSCDLIYDRINERGEKVFYIIQSKWVQKSNSKKSIDSTDVKSALSDFDTIIQGTPINSKNENFNDKVKQLNEHIRKNGACKFIFLTLAQKNSAATENISAFKRRQGSRVFIDVLDIKRLKHDYIDRTFKKIKHANPMEPDLAGDMINSEIKIEKLGNVENFIQINNPYRSYILLVRPGEFHRLFKEYGFSLFQKNIRNPLLSSKINSEIKNTIKDNPASFWYYNNGVTAIASVLPDLGNCADCISIQGLQIINGAQTVYSIYSAFEEATEAERNIIDNEALVTLRLLKSGGKEFDLKVTKNTNSQNPITPSDFWSNDYRQIEIQKELYNHDALYIRRRGEFRDPPKNYLQITSKELASAYYIYHLQEPSSFYKVVSDNDDLLFTSHKENQNGLYEKIFDNDFKVTDAFSAFLVYNTLITSREMKSSPAVMRTLGALILALTKVVLDTYIKSIEPSRTPSDYIIEKCKDDRLLIKKALFVCAEILFREILKFSSEEILNSDEKNETLSDDQNSEKREEENSTDILMESITKDHKYKGIREKFEEIDNIKQRMEQVDMSTNFFTWSN